MNSATPSVFLLVIVGLVAAVPTPLIRRLGVAKGFEKAHARLAVADQIVTKAALPVEFTVAKQWPECAGVVNHISNQGDCGSCWAVSSAGVFSDRRCISSGGKIAEQFSADDLMSCCDACMGVSGNGCDGGYPSEAFQWFVDTGVVTGGSKDFEPGCRPYPVPAVSKCEKKCVSTFNGVTYQADKHYSRQVKAIERKSPEQMQQHLMANGSLDVTYEVFKDFYYNYTSGVYVKQPDAQSVGWHAVRIVGWGHDAASDLPYWLVANSWSTKWGMDGFFKIVRGRNECSIEEFPVAGNF